MGNVSHLALARGDVRPQWAPLLPTILVGVSDAQWTQFVRALEVQGLKDISESGGLGCFAMRPKRMKDLGLMTNLHTARTPTGRQVYSGDFVKPLTADLFLNSYVRQYSVLCDSIGKWVDGAKNLKHPAGVSASEALAVLHHAGPGALAKWAQDKFEQTQKLVARAAGIF